MGIILCKLRTGKFDLDRSICVLCGRLTSCLVYCGRKGHTTFSLLYAGGMLYYAAHFSPTVHISLIGQNFSLALAVFSPTLHISGLCWCIARLGCIGLFLCYARQISLLHWGLSCGAVTRLAQKRNRRETRQPMRYVLLGHSTGQDRYQAERHCIEWLCRMVCAISSGGPIKWSWIIPSVGLVSALWPPPTHPHPRPHPRPHPTPTPGPTPRRWIR